MCEPTTIATLVLASSAVSTGIGVYSSLEQGKYQQRVAESNAALTEMEAERALTRSEEEAAAIRRKGSQMKGDQRASYAARGLDLTSGTPADILDQTDFFTQTDIATTRSNAKADRELARYGAAAERAGGRSARSQGNLGAFSTLLTGATRVAGKWYDYDRAGVWK